MNTPQLEKGTPQYLLLQEILIIGNSSEQVMVIYISTFCPIDWPPWILHSLRRAHLSIYSYKKYSSSATLLNRTWWFIFLLSVPSTDPHEYSTAWEGHTSVSTPTRNTHHRQLFWTGNGDLYFYVLSHRLTPMNTPQLEKGTPQYLLLQEILIILNSSEQVMVIYISTFCPTDWPPWILHSLRRAPLSIYSCKKYS